MKRFSSHLGLWDVEAPTKDEGALPYKFHRLLSPRFHSLLTRTTRTR